MRRRTLAMVGSLAAGAVAAGSAVALTMADSPHVSAAQVTGATVRKPARPGDFNGDGRRELVLPNPGVTDGGHYGRVLVLPGSPHGPVPAQRDVVTRGRAGLPATSSEGFAAETVSADFDGDGYADLAATTAGPNAKTSGVIVMYGGPKGLTSRHVFLHGPRGYGLVAADFNGNGKPDLVSLDERASKDGNYYYRTFYDFGAGTVQPTATRWAKSTLPQEVFRTTAADFNGDGKADLAMTFWGSQEEEKIRAVGFGAVSYGSAKGLGAPKRFGTGWPDLTMGAGDVNGDGKADLVVEQYRTGKQIRQVSVLYGGKSGLGKPVTFSKNTPGVPGTATAGDGFGRHIAVGDLNGDGLADVAIGAAFTKVGKIKDAGAISILYGTRKGLTGKGARSVNLSLKGAPAPSKARDLFGWQVAVQDLNGDGKNDLVVGAGRTYASTPYSGAVYIFPGGRGGPLLKGSQWITPASLKVKGDPQLGDRIMP